MRTVSSNNTTVLPLGKQGENLAQKIIFTNHISWLKCYGPGTVQLLNQRPGEDTPYPVVISAEEDGSYSWAVTDVDTYLAGDGKCELQYLSGGTLVKSNTWKTVVKAALVEPSVAPPEAQQGWVDKVLQAGTDAQEAAKRAEIAATRQPYPNEATGTWWVWDAEAGAYKDTGISYGSSGGGTNDHIKLSNRNAADQHPMSAITGLVGALGGKVSVAGIINNLTTNAANKPLSAAQGVALKALIDAIRIPEKLPNPNALTFTGAVDGSYDGSEPKTINIPSGGGDIALGITGATVGQIAKITAVDENGQPTEWEAADMPSGGGSGGGIHRIARVVTEANAASIEVTGLSTTAEVLSLRIYNPGSNCGMGLNITVNGVQRINYGGTIEGTSTDKATVRVWLYRDGGTLYGRAIMTNTNIIVFNWPEIGEITSITVGSPYNDGTTKYFQTGTIFEIYEGVYPNVN